MMSMSLNDSQRVNSDKLQQLNSSINEAKTQFSVKIQELNETTQTQLNASVYRLHQRVIPQLNSSLNGQQASLLALKSSIQMDLTQYSDSLDELRRLHPVLSQTSPVFSCAALIDLPLLLFSLRSLLGFDFKRLCCACVL
jgi:paraquat-inducible protein B